MLLAVIVCLLVWLAVSRDNAAELYSETGVWDFRGLFTGDDSYWLSGTVEYIPNTLLKPEGFAEREGEAIIGQPQDVSQYATSRLRLLMPDDGYNNYFGMKPHIYPQDMSSFSMMLFTFYQTAAVFIAAASEMKTTAAENAALNSWRCL